MEKRLKEHGLYVEFSDDAKDFILNAQYGARPLKEYFKEWWKMDCLLHFWEKISDGDIVSIDKGGSGLTFFKKGNWLLYGEIFW